MIQNKPLLRQRIRFPMGDGVMLANYYVYQLYCFTTTQSSNLKKIIDYIVLLSIIILRGKGGGGKGIPPISISLCVLCKSVSRSGQLL